MASPKCPLPNEDKTEVIVFGLNENSVYKP